MSVGSIINAKGAEVISTSADAGVGDIVELLHSRRIGAVLVVESGRILGVVSERDIVRNLHRRGTDALNATARDIMTSPVVTVSPRESIGAVMTLMTERRIRHLPVVDGDSLVGMLSIGDVVKRRIEDAEREAEALKDYIQNS